MVINIGEKVFYALYITNKTESTFVLNVEFFGMDQTCVLYSMHAKRMSRNCWIFLNWSSYE